MSGHQDNRSAGLIPQRWLHCPRKAAGVVANKFLAFKTPLSSQYDDQVPEDCRFSPSMIFQSMKSYEMKLGLWIDLTNTSRFYNKKQIEAEGCRYIKMKCRGHSETPSKEVAKAFFVICQEFINENPLEIIGVHCTHGFNRTGFLIVSYLVEQMDYSLDAALNQFAVVRPPGIYKKDYLQELYKRYDDIDDTPLPPQLPNWYREYDDSNGDGGDDKDGNNSTDTAGGAGGSSGRRRRREYQNKNPTFMQGVSGATPITAQAKLQNIQRKVQDFCGWQSNGFPGCQPVSMDTKNISLLGVKPYRVSWKADGTRYMMLILQENEIYFIDRDNSVFQVSGLKFPHRKDFKRHLVNTLLDGEMVIDKVNGQDIPRYLAYDIIKFDGCDVGRSAFYPVRLACIEKEIVQPRHQAMKEGRIDKSSEPFSVRLKQFWDITQAERLLSDKFSKMLSHEPDGLIFQPSKEPYIPGSCSEVLKWKPLSHNSVDFKLKIETEEGQGILKKTVGLLYVGGMDRPFGKMKVNKTLKELNNKIVECKFQDNQWIFMRERIDKSFPNSYSTAEAVCNSIRHPVTKDILLDYIERNRWSESDQDLMPPPVKVPRR
ncbi:mRNA-capping enzyme [Zootermopsis nevadensis]|nr:mRNA-capping enzyme [Zootermopsis nevadensis]